MKMGEKIRENRKRMGLTQTELGRLIDVDKTTIYKYEKGLIVNIKRDSILKLAEVFGISPSELLDDRDAISFRRAEVIRLFNELNDEGQERAIEYMQMLAQNGYIKNNKDDLVEENA